MTGLELETLPTWLLYPAGFAACFRIGAALTVINQPRLPIFDGYPVGSKVVEFPATCETNDSNAKITTTTTGRMRLFYPCHSTEDSLHYAPYCTDGRATSDGMAALVGFRQIGLSFLLAYLANATSGCFENARPVTQQPFPLMIYSHGYGGNMDMATCFLRNIAAQRVIVAALEHTDGTASSTVVRDENTNTTRRLDSDPSLYALEDGLRIRASEMLKAMEYTPYLFSNIDAIFLGGHSYGAPSALLASQSSKGNTGLILHDPALSMGQSLLKFPPTSPTISYTSDEYHRAGIRCGDITYHVQGLFMVTLSMHPCGHRYG
eukprot:scaffold1936_cov154-Amphora_coffeaeformis.AAC.7